MRILPRPRKYLTDKNTISDGVRNWIEGQMSSITDRSKELESFSRMIRQAEPETIVSAIVDRLSLDKGPRKQNESKK